MKRHLVCFLIVLSVVLLGVQIVLAQNQDVDKINSLLQKGTWKLTYHDTGMKWRKLEFYSFQSTFIVDVVYEKVINYISYEDKGSMLYQPYSSNTIRFVCSDLLMPFPQTFKAKIVKLSEKTLILKVGKGLDVFIREDVKPDLPPVSLRKYWYGKGKKVEVKLCFHSDGVVEAFSRKKNSSSFIRFGVFPFKFFDLGIPSIVRIDFGKNGIDDFLFYPRKIIEEGEGMTLIPVPAKPVSY